MENRVEKEKVNKLIKRGLTFEMLSGILTKLSDRRPDGARKNLEKR